MRFSLYPTFILLQFPSTRVARIACKTASHLRRRSRSRDDHTGAHAASKNGCELSRVLRFFTMLRYFGFSAFRVSDVVGVIDVRSAPTRIGAMGGARHQAQSAFAACEMNRTLGLDRLRSAQRVRRRRFGMDWHELCFCLIRELVYAGSTPRAPNVEPRRSSFTPARIHRPRHCAWAPVRAAIVAAEPRAWHEST